MQQRPRKAAADERACLLSSSSCLHLLPWQGLVLQFRAGCAASSLTRQLPSTSTAHTKRQHPPRTATAAAVTRCPSGCVFAAGVTCQPMLHPAPTHTLHTFPGWALPSPAAGCGVQSASSSSRTCPLTSPQPSTTHRWAPSLILACALSAHPYLGNSSKPQPTCSSVAVLRLSASAQLMHTTVLFCAEFLSQ